MRFIDGAALDSRHHDAGDLRALADPCGYRGYGRVGCPVQAGLREPRVVPMSFAARLRLNRQMAICSLPGERR